MMTLICLWERWTCNAGEAPVKSGDLHHTGMVDAAWHRQCNWPEGRHENHSKSSNLYEASILIWLGSRCTFKRDETTRFLPRLSDLVVWPCYRRPRTLFAHNCVILKSILFLVQKIFYTSKSTQSFQTKGERNFWKAIWLGG